MWRAESPSTGPAIAAAGEVAEAEQAFGRQVIRAMSVSG
jgi:hypothetical protein